MIFLFRRPALPAFKSQLPSLGYVDADFIDQIIVLSVADLD